ncbi:FAD-binding protein [Paracoccus sanguinis]|uniref:FAD-binding protein n=1 Tax=Paracoccus sanguinis TaxID=1545044 RepID=UPI0014528876|nr:FAD-binding protein [Paracoccus sanguinis]QJD18109.1 FAD-binding protein [Paracoccus sanguinis]
MRPESEAELAAMIRGASGPLTPVGGGTRLAPGEGQGVRLATAGLSGVILYEPAALTLVARAGTPLSEIEAALAAEGQRLAFEPPRFTRSTIGGVIAANASGPRRVKDGAARDSALGVRFVDGRGEVIQSGGRVMKNVTGYDLVKLMAGSRGRLGVLTEVSLKTQPIPPASATLALPGLGAAAAIPALTAALTGPWDVTGAGWLPGHGALIRIEGLAGSVARRAESLAARLGAWGGVTRRDDDPWRLLDPNIPECGAAPRSRDLWRITCRPSEAALLLERLPEPLSLDWGGGLIRVALPAGETPDLTGTRAIATRLTGATPLSLPPMAPAVAALNDGLRARFDPRGLFTGAF